MYLYKFRTDTLKSSDYYIWFRSYPVIKRGVREVSLTSVPGRYGTLARKEDFWSDTTVSMEIDITPPVFETLSVDKVYEKFRERLAASKVLYLEELHTRFLRIKKVDLNVVKESDITMSISLTCTCDPGEYIDAGRYEHPYLEVQNNPYSVCCPTYLITGNGSCTLTVNGEQMKATVGQNLTINTELMLAYRTDGTMQNTAVSGDYENLYLQPGDNSISITNGFGLKVIPNWRCL